jgi:uncharacterized membrane protein YGL010W
MTLRQPPQTPKSNEWVTRYAQGHQHPVNRVCHTIGIPMILLAIALATIAFLVDELWWLALALFIGGWVLQFIGHAFEGKPPEFFSDWRFLFVGVKWWFEKMRGRA